MRLRRYVVAVVVFLTAMSMPAQERGYWNAASSAAKSITGDLSFAPDKLTINFSTFTLAQIRQLKPDEKLALFPDAGDGVGNLYRVQISGDKRFVHKNTLCGGDDTDWVVTWVAGKELYIAMFSGPSIPALTPEALTNSQRMCGTFMYTR